MEPSDLQMKLNRVAEICFRNIADNDYISARTLFRYELIHQAYWCSLQTIEKYLKAILLFNGKSTIRLSHDLHHSLKLIKDIKEINFTLPKDVLIFIDLINNEGANRYYEYPYAMEKSSLFILDKTVWSIRKFCFYMKGEVRLNESIIDLLDFSLNQIDDKRYNEKPYLYSINGELENILQEKKLLKREQLVWMNKYYGSRKKGKIFLKHETSTYGLPPHFSDESIFEDIKEYVQFSKPVLDYFKKRSTGKIKVPVSEL